VVVLSRIQSASRAATGKDFGRRRDQLLLAGAIGCALLVTQVASASAEGGFQRWRFGMSPAEVQRIKDCGPYAPVKSTGGLECRVGTFLGERATISFVFKDDKLHKIQVWAYEGKVRGAAILALHRLLQQWKKENGGAESPSITVPHTLSRDALTKALQQAIAKNSGPVTKLQFKPKRDAKDAFSFGSLIYWRVKDAYYVFVYFQPSRRARA
jgi:hypothetical protein